LTIIFWLPVIASILALAVIAAVTVNLWTISFLYLVRTPRSGQADLAGPILTDFPDVLIQLPMFNEMLVAERVIAAACALDWPRTALHIQVLDDSTDETRIVARAAVERYKAAGYRIEYCHRTIRSGFKAGALKAGFDRTSHPYIAVFDADFVPAPRFLRDVMPALQAMPRAAFVQTRWEHLNADENLLTKAQSMLLDAHFGVEQTARTRNGLILPFNGTCGVWRREAIEAAGGWQADTLCEDLDLSIRTHLAGWRALYLPEISVPGELPSTLAAWQSQQFRWTKGFIQVAKKLLVRIWRSAFTVPQKLALTLQICQPLCYPATGLLLLSMVPLAWTQQRLPLELALASLTVAISGIAGSISIMCLGQFMLRRDCRSCILGQIAVLLLGSGLVISNSWAVLTALSGKVSPFVRTPKKGDGVSLQTNGPRSFIPRGSLELLAACAIVTVASLKSLWLSPLTALPVAGLAIVGGGQVSQRMRLRLDKVAIDKDLDKLVEQVRKAA
jgi:cellulose synthase/poly-beta-1,6-N-acetylglucosamine synthase-like glycosyltransferase